MATNKKNKILWWIIGGGAVVYLVSKLTTTKPDPSPPQDAGSGTATPNTDFPIVYNKYSAKAKDLQAILNVKQDGIIGPITLAAIKFYFPAFTVAFKIANQSELNYMINTIKSKRNTYTTTPPLVYDRAVAGLSKNFC